MKKIFYVLLASLITTGLYAAEPVATEPEGESVQPAAQETDLPIDKKPAKKSQKSFKDNLFFGGYLNLSFGSYTVIGIEPMIGYKINPKLSAGVKVRYDYIKDDRSGRDYTTSTYGGSIFGRYSVTPKFYAQAEVASYNYEYFYVSGSDRDWVPFLFLGGGFVQPLGERSWLNIQVLFDVLQDNASPYDNWEPFFSIGVGTGF